MLNDPKFAAVVEHFAAACAASRAHDERAAAALQEYGNHGAQISGCVRDHFPAAVKDELRNLARIVSVETDAAYAARPARVHFYTIRKIGNLVAARDGAGFYGPQPAYVWRYGDKRDYRKIDLYRADGSYIASTTWARTCREALEHCPEASKARFA